MTEKKPAPTRKRPPAKHLWEYDHPYIGAGDFQRENESLDSLIEELNSLDPDLNHIYRWDWLRNERVVEPERGDLFIVYVLLPRKGEFVGWACRVTAEDEEKVTAFLKSPRVRGAIKKLWAPLL